VVEDQTEVFGGGRADARVGEDRLAAVEGEAGAEGVGVSREGENQERGEKKMPVSRGAAQAIRWIRVSGFFDQKNSLDEIWTSRGQFC
jgi:hypothetical protein